MAETAVKENNVPEGLTREDALKELEKRLKYHPLRQFIPNIAQERALKCYEKPNPETKDYPVYNIFTGGNGVGKTADMAVLLNGVAYGNDYLDKRYYNYKYFDDCEKIRRKRPLSIRIVCANVDMDETGSVYQQIKKWIPTAKFSGKLGGNYYTKIKIPRQSPNHYATVIDIKTHDQDLIKFAGPDKDLILFNEPINDEKKFDENVGRIRMGGRIAMFMTPLAGCGYVQKLILDPTLKNIVHHTEGNIWENCKDRPGTRGILAEDRILALIAKWRNNPVQLKARVEGKFIHLAGAAFPIFDFGVHVIKPLYPDRLPQDFMLVQVVDHHPKKPAVSVHLALSPLGIWYIIGEYPVEEWDEITTNEKSIKQFGYDFKLIEAGKNPKFPYFRNSKPVHKDNRIGDPNAFKAEQPHNRQTIQWQYEQDCELYYNIEVDNSIELRHNKIRELLYYDVTRPMSSTNTPHLFIYSTCTNVQNAFINYLLDDNGKPEEEWKDWIDCIGYGVTTVEHWINQESREDEPDEYAEYLKGMEPGYNKEMVGHGHEAISKNELEFYKYT
jgi:hypothetical protein